MSTYYQTGHGRVFLQRYGAGPGHSVAYQGCMRLGGSSEPLGDVTPVYCPDPRAYDRFEVVDEVKGEGGLPTVSAITKFGRDNEIMRLVCPFDIHAHYGKCKNPTDFDDGWETSLVFEKARITTRSTDELTAFSPDGRAEILITAEITARAIHEVKQLLVSERAAHKVSLEIVDVAVCDQPSCGECGEESDGCQDLYAIAVGSGLGSPGLPAELLYSEDGGTTWAETDIDTLGTDEDPTAMACVSDDIVVISYDSNSVHWANTDDPDIWAEVAGVFNAVGQPNDIFSAGPNDTWIVGENGYIYFTTDPTSAAAYVTQEAGTLTGEDLNRVHGLDESIVVAVGDGNEVLFTLNGGETWENIVGPAVGQVLTALWVRTAYTWLVGADDGNLYFTGDQGLTWAQIAFTGDGVGTVHDIAFAGNDSPFGYLALETDVPAGRILRSLNGGYSWHELPEPAGATFPASDAINAVAACVYDVNFVLGGGLADDGADGILVIGK